jgi:uncharacterized protein
MNRLVRFRGDWRICRRILLCGTCLVTGLLAGARGVVLARRSAVEGIRKERRGFASMSPEKQREIASKGGRAAHEKGTAHEWSQDEARAAGRKGGQISRGGRGRLAPTTPSDVNNGAAAPGSGMEPGSVE